MRACAIKNYQLAYNCCQLKSVRKTHSLWFYNTTLHIKLMKSGLIQTTFHPTDIEKVLAVDNLDKYIKNVSF